MWQSSAYGCTTCPTRSRRMYQGHRKTGLSLVFASWKVSVVMAAVRQVSMLQIFRCKPLQEIFKTTKVIFVLTWHRYIVLQTSQKLSGINIMMRSLSYSSELLCFENMSDVYSNLCIRTMSLICNAELPLCIPSLSRPDRCYR